MNNKAKIIVFFLVGMLLEGSVMAHKERDTIGVGERIRFVENKTQWQQHVRYKVAMANNTVFFHNDGYTVFLSDPKNPTGKNPEVDKNRNKTYRYHAYRVVLVDADTMQVTINPKDKEEYYENYFIGKDPSRWSSHVGVYAGISYSDIYPNVDMNVYGNSRGLKYEMVVRPGGMPRRIKMRYDGVDGLSLRNGSVLIKTSISDVMELKPYAYQMVDGKEVAVECSYVLDRQNRMVTFRVGDYNTKLPLVIDPQLIFSTYTGSAADNWGTTATYDLNRNTYSSGVVFGVGYPCHLGAMDTTFNGNADLGIFKLNADGSQRLYATYLGGSQADMPHSMYVNEFNELVVMGTTGSSNFPTTPTAYDTSFNGGTVINYLGINGTQAHISYPNGSDIFVSRLSTDGTQLAASTYIGGAGNDGLNYKRSFSNSNYNIIFDGNDSLYCNYGDGARGELITDDMNNIYVGSCSFSYNFPLTPGSFQTSYGGGQDGVVFKLDYNLSNLLWSSYIGGSGDDAVYSIDTDSEYNLIVSGGTNSANFPTTVNAYQPTFAGGGADCFVAKINYGGSQLLASTFYGSDSNEQAYFVRLSNNNDIHIFGQTRAGGNTMIYNALYNTPGSGQLLAKFTPNLDTLVWSTVFGTGGSRPNISPTAFEVDICGRVYCAGWGRDFCGYNINGQNIPWNTYGTAGMQTSLNAIQSSTDGQDFYIISIAGDASAVEYATFFGELHLSAADAGGDHVDGGTSRFDRMGTLYQSVCASCGGAQDFPTTAGSWDTVNRSTNCNNGIFKLNIHDDFPVADFITPTVGCAPDTIDFENVGRGTSFYWDFGDSTYSAEQNPTHIYATPGIYTVTLIATMANGCSTGDTLRKDLVVLGDTTYFLDTVYTCPNLPVQIGIQPVAGYTYHWVGHAVSDSSVANPFITVSEPTTLTLLANNGVCTDTMVQHVCFRNLQLDIVCDSSSCANPLLFSAITGNDDIVSYQWSTNPNFTDTLNTNTQLPDVYIYIDTASYFYLRIESAQGCSAVDSIYADFELIRVAVDVKEPSCPNSCDAFAMAEVFNGTAPYTYTWTNLSDGTELSDGDTAAMLCPGQYYVLVADAYGCEANYNFSIANPQPPQVSKEVVHAPCDDVCTGSIAIDMLDYEGVCSYLWPDDNSTSPSRTNLCEGIYIAQITYDSVCVIYDTTAIEHTTNLKLNQSVSPVCDMTDCDGSATITINGGMEPYSFQWSNGATGSTADGLCEGVYTVTSTDSQGCKVTDTVHVWKVHTFDTMEVWAERYTIFRGQSTRLNATAIDGVSYNWLPAESLETPHSYTTIATPDDTTIYYMNAVDQNHCRYTDTVKVNCINLICGQPNLVIPNAFSPNDDGVNDKMCFRGEWIREFHIAIFSRWGEKVFETYDINECWDGRYDGKKCQSGVYMYTCDIVCEDNQAGTFKGDVTIIQ